MIYTDEKGLTYQLNQENFTAVIIKCNRKISNISIPRSVRYGSHDFVITTIGQHSFAYHNNITQITFSSDSELKLIDKESFSNSTLFVISIPSSVTKIGPKAFYGCYYLKRVNIKDDSQLSIIEEKAFKLSGIENFSLPPFVKKICEGSFDACSQLSIFSIPKNSQLTTIGREALSFSKISYLYFPDDLKEFGKCWCFAMTKLEQIDISPKNKNFKYINEDHSMIASKSNPNDDSYDVLFFVTRKVEFVSVPSFIKYINTSAISGCEKLEDIEFKKKSQLISIDEGAFSFSNISSITIPASVKQIKQYAFYHCQHLEEVSFKKSSKLESIGKFAFANTMLLTFFFPENLVKFDKEWCNNIYYLRYIEVSPLNKCLSYIDENFIISKSNPNDDVFDSLLFVNRTAEKVKIPSFIKYIKSSSFYYCDKLQTIELPDDSQLVSIESNAFNFSSLKEFFVPKHVKVIKKNAFKNSNLASIKFCEDSELVKIGKFALDTDSLESFTIPANVEIIKEGFNSNSRILKHISISPKNKNFKLMNENLVVGKSDPKIDCFDNLIFVNDDFDKIKIPSFIKRICKFVFKSIVNLKTVDFEENSKLDSIGVSAFENTSIKCITIPNSVKIIEKNAFQNCANLTNVEFMGDDVLVDSECFWQSKLVRVISFPNASKVSFAFDAFQYQSCRMFICAGGELNKLMPKD